MSILTNFHTYEPMEDAVITDVSTEDTDHPAEHAISPLEPDFAWEITSNSSPYIIVDLGKPCPCDGFTFIHHETEILPSDFDVIITAEYSSDGSNWDSTFITYNSDGTASPNDLYDSDTQIKVRYFIENGTETLKTLNYRYWKFSIGNVGSPMHSLPNDCRISMCWLFSLHTIDKGSAFPFNDTEIYPNDEIELAFGKSYFTGHSVNSHTVFSRNWLLNNTEYNTIITVMKNCNGVYRPFLLIEDNERKLCKFEKDEINETFIDEDFYNISCNFIQLPIVKKDKYH